MVAQNLSSKTQKFLTNASMLYRDICPEQARFLMKRHQLDGPPLPDSVLCPFCFQWRRPGEYHVRVRPKRMPSPQVKKLLRWEAANRRLSAQQTKVLSRFRRSSSVVMATCHTCNQISKQTGVNREFLAAFPKPTSTPLSTSKCKTPKSAKRPASKSGSNQKTPNSTPVSRSSEAPSSSRSAKEKSSAFSRLKKLLMLEDSQKSKKGSLKDFLSSL
ncbi:UPF0711 protein C18orf21 homolog [Electrophorus electricus]|uniref:UPF0711 protein C18orf21 homolog n=1 Tax=Electrophorus electricus TaxID=8005 RepID=UPI0015D08580|nr:UPF0711 protein C18orf21 homolog [Electrophorus electricus]XP_026885775.2 UPF0711 protein C18orf21 homolog [Electrophorus electricus]